MAKRRNPRHGSMQFWPRVRAKKETARIRSYSTSKEPKLLAFAGYKAGMTFVQYTDAKKTSLTKGQTVAEPVTIIECPPVTIIGARAYKQTEKGAQILTQFNAPKLPREVLRRIITPKKEAAPTFDKLNLDEISHMKAIVATNPKVAGLAKKTADIFEVPIGGDKQAQMDFIKNNLGKTIKITDVFAAGELVDTHAVTKGKGTQGPVKRFGVSLTAKKSEKTRRGPGSLGPWKAQGHVMYRIAYSGTMGYHLRTDYNKKITAIEEDPQKINPKGGISKYGEVKTSYVLLRGSVSGPKKRLITITQAIRPNKKFKGDAPIIEYISTEPTQ